MNPTSEPQAWEKYTDLAVGEILRRARVQYNLTLEDVAKALHIRAPQLQALEDSRPDLLPGRVYAIGFVRAYSEFLDLDGDKMVHLFKAQTVGGRVRPELTMPIPASESKAPNRYILGGSIAALVVFAALLIVFGSRHKKHGEDIPPVPANITVQDKTPPQPVPLAAPPPVTATTAPTAAAVAVPVTPSSRIIIKARDNVWLEIRNAQKKVLFSRILKEGDSYNVPDQPGLKLDTGDAGALILTVDGKSVQPLGNTGDVRRNLVLEPAILEQGSATTAKTNAAKATAHAKKHREPTTELPPAASEPPVDTSHFND